LNDSYTLPPSFSFSSVVREFETRRVEDPDEYPWVNFTSALSNAGYAQNRMRQRFNILMSFILQKYPSMTPKNAGRRLFTEEQKIAIWDRADRQCEWVDDNGRCGERFPNFREADADHFFKWSEGGTTTVENGRLLCRTHNRRPR
jgi:hypothetical protein